MPITKIRHPKKVELLTHVKCDKRRHRIALINGKFVPVDHPYWKRELKMMEIGGPEPYCLNLMKHWGYAHSGPGLPEKLREAHFCVRTKYNWRNRTWTKFTSTLAIGPINWDICDIYKRIRLAIMYRCDYHCLRFYQWRMYVQTSHEHHPDVSAHGAIAVLINPDGMVDTEIVSIGICVKRNWIDTVWRPGWAVVEKHLALDYMSFLPKSASLDCGIATLMVEVDCGRNRKFVIRQAEVATLPETKKRYIIRWLDPCVLSTKAGV